MTKSVAGIIHGTVLVQLGKLNGCRNFDSSNRLGNKLLSLKSLLVETLFPDQVALVDLKS